MKDLACSFENFVKHRNIINAWIFLILSLILSLIALQGISRSLDAPFAVTVHFSRQIMQSVSQIISSLLVKIAQFYKSLVHEFA
jgi:hypothetical protein